MNLYPVKSNPFAAETTRFGGLSGKFKQHIAALNFPKALLYEARLENVLMYSVLT